MFIYLYTEYSIIQWIIWFDEEEKGEKISDGYVCDYTQQVEQRKFDYFWIFFPLLLFDLRSYCLRRPTRQKNN